MNQGIIGSSWYCDHYDNLNFISTLFVHFGQSLAQNNNNNNNNNSNNNNKNNKYGHFKRQISDISREKT